MNNHLVWIGTDVYVPYENIEMFTRYGLSATKKLVKQAKEECRLFDYSGGHVKETVALLKSGSVIITPAELLRVLDEVKNDSSSRL